MNVLSLFDGISCGQLALNRAGILYNQYYASEIDVHAIKITQRNFPNTIQLGSVLSLRSIELPNIDLIIGGSPCQGFSFAGKQLNFEDPRSKLFFEYVRLLNSIKIYNPDVKFLLENVKMKKEYQDIISEHLGVKPILINSALVSAQNRQRLYWTNIEGVTQPEDRKIMLQDILEHGVVDRDKSFCLDANYWKGTTLEQYLTKSRRQIVFTERRSEEARMIRKQYMKEFGKDYSPRRSKELVPREDNKANCLTTSLTKEHILLDEQNVFRKLTPIECERLQTVPAIKKRCIFTLCLDQVKNYVNVVERNPKLLKLVENVEILKLKEFVETVKENTLLNLPKISNSVPPHVNMKQVKEQETTSISQLENNTLVNSVESTAMSKNLKIEEDSVDLNAFINITEGKITQFGLGELPLKGNPFITQESGKNVLRLSGKEVMQLAKDVEKNTSMNQNNNSIFTILSPLSIQNIEQILIIYYWFVKNVTTGYIQTKTQKKNISIQFDIEEGYTYGISNTQRYKALGNGFTVEVIAHIFKNLK